MKSSIKFIFAALCFSYHAAYALNPLSGWYAGVVLGGSYAPNTNLNLNLPNTANSNDCSSMVGCLPPIQGDLHYSGYGNIGGQIGYRLNQLRLEIEPMVNYNPYQTITVNSQRFVSPKSSTSLRIKGNTTTAAGFLNGYYDFYSGDSNLVPYLGAGIGYAYIRNQLDFYCNDVEIACTKTSLSTTSPIVQGILGLSYFLDDFTWFGLDYRYISTRKMNSLIDGRVQVNTINISFNGLFNCA